MAVSEWIEPRQLIFLIMLLDGPGTVKEIERRLASDLGMRRTPDQIRAIVEELRKPEVDWVEYRKSGLFRKPLIALTEDGRTMALKWVDFFRTA